jgi:hypothetical protein
MTTDQLVVATEMPPLPEPEKPTIAAAVVALMIKKGGTLRLNKSELAEMRDYVLTLADSPNNPNVLHIGAITREEMREKIIREVIARGLQGEAQ